MVVRVQSDHVLAIGQLSHAWLSGQLARAWGNDAIAAPQPREAVALGAEQHDIGWAHVDLEPVWDENTGLPQNFLKTSVGEHLAIWRDAPSRLLTQSVHAALVISLHGRALSQLRLAASGVSGADADALQAHIERERERQAQLAAMLALPPEWLVQTQRQMWAWDGISLALCSRWSPFSVREVPAAAGSVELELSELDGGRWALEPWPFAGERVLARCQARRLDAERFADARALLGAWAQAPVIDLEFALERS